MQGAQLQVITLPTISGEDSNLKDNHYTWFIWGYKTKWDVHYLHHKVYYNAQALKLFPIVGISLFAI